MNKVITPFFCLCFILSSISCKRNEHLTDSSLTLIESKDMDIINEQIKLKPEIHGLVSMGYVAGILRHKGKKGSFSDGTGSPSEDLDDVFSKPGIFRGVVFNLTWKELEPDPGNIITKVIDDHIYRVREYNKKYPQNPLLIRLRVSCGRAAPFWAKKIGGDPIKILDPKGNYITVGHFWSEAYRKAWRNFQNQLAKVYDDEPLIADVTVTSGMTNSDENMNLATNSFSIENMHAAGFNDSLFVKVIKGSGEDYSAWKKTRLNFLINPFRFSDSSKAVFNEEFTLSLMKYFKTKYGKKAILSNHSFQSPHTERLEFIYQGIKALGEPFDYQTHSPKKIDMEATVKDAAAMGATTLELWNNYVDYPNEVLMRWKRLFDQNKGYGKINSQNKKHPNVVILIADDISRDDFGCYGHPVIKTPNIDKLAKNGLKFTNVVLTTSSCSPSRTSIITGRYPHNTGAPELHSPIPDGQVFFPKKLKDAGYYTAQSGKWHFGDSPSIPSGVALQAFDLTGGSSLDGGGKSGSKKWVKVLEERPKEKPFFMWFASHDAHRTWDNEFEVSYLPKDVIVPPYMIDNLETRKDLVAYYQEVTRFDQNVGRVVNELEKQGVLDNTIIIIMADNGRPFPRDKTRLYDSGILTPFIVHYPNKIKNKGQTCESLISVIDIAPTIIELTNSENSKSFQGISFANLLENPNTPFREYAFAEHNWHDFSAYERMVRTEKYTYIENGLPEQSNIGAADVLNGGAGQSLLKAKERNNDLTKLQGEIFKIPQPKTQLYDRDVDPNQFKNLSNNPDYKKIEKALRIVLKNWEKDTKDTQPKILTPDWYDRWTMEGLETKGTRGTMPGSELQADKI